MGKVPVSNANKTATANNKARGSVRPTSVSNAPPVQTAPTSSVVTPTNAKRRRMNAKRTVIANKKERAKTSASVENALFANLLRHEVVLSSVFVEKAARPVTLKDSGTPAPGRSAKQVRSVVAEAVNLLFLLAKPTKPSVPIAALIPRQTNNTAAPATTLVAMSSFVTKVNAKTPPVQSTTIAAQARSVKKGPARPAHKALVSSERSVVRAKMSKSAKSSMAVRSGRRPTPARKRSIVRKEAAKALCGP